MMVCTNSSKPEVQKNVYPINDDAAIRIRDKLLSTKDDGEIAYRSSKMIQSQGSTSNEMHMSLNGDTERTNERIIEAQDARQDEGN